MINETLLTRIINVRAYNGVPKPKIPFGIKDFESKKVRSIKGFENWLNYIVIENEKIHP